jgi:surface antigen
MRHRAVAKLAPIVLLVFTLTSCSTMVQTVQENPKAVLGTVLGAGAGAGIAAAAGAGGPWIAGAGIMGALLGGFIGNRLDARDKRLAAEAATRAFENNHTGQASVWRNPDSGNSGSITPTRTYQLANGQYCREYRQTVTIGGEQHQAYGTACRRPDGSWQIQS